MNEGGRERKLLPACAPDGAAARQSGGTKDKPHTLNRIPPMKIDFVPFQELRPHKLVKDLPRWAEDDPQYLSLVDDIAARGIDQPLFVVGDAIVDGVLRWRAAKRMQLASVPVVQRKEDEVPELAMQSMLQRRHLTKSARAYICYPLMDKAWMAVSRRQSSINNPLRGLLIIDSYVEQSPGQGDPTESPL